MRRPISLKIFSITLAPLLLMVLVTWLSVFNLRLQQQVARWKSWCASRWCTWKG